MTIKEGVLDNAIALIPYFDGCSLTLDEYYNCLNAAKSIINESAESELTNLAVNKLTGEAKQLATLESIEDIEQLEFFLASNFG